MAEINISKTEKNVTLSVSADVGEHLTVNEQHDLLVGFLSLSRDLFRELHLKLVADCDFLLPPPDGDRVLEHFGLPQEEGTSIFESSKLAELFLVLSSTSFSAPRRFIVDFDPEYPYSVLRESGTSTAQSEH